MNTSRPANFIELFTPKLITVFREGYHLRHFQADIAAGLTVAIVALPLSMAIAIASGTSPDRGLYTAIVGGFLVSLLGGSRFQIGGPAGAFIVLVAATVQRHGLDGLLLATIVAGLILITVGFFRLGTYIKFIPYPVTVGFTAGVAVIVFASQIRDIFGLTLAVPEPGPILDKIPALFNAWSSVNPAAAAVALGTILIIGSLKRLAPGLPGMLIAVAAASFAAVALSLPVETIGSRFGGIPAALPMPAIPEITLAKIHAILPDAIAFALLGAIESLLSAVVADGMTGRHHRSNCELVAQGAANVASGFFGGICVTGTIARTATNVRSGAHGPVSGILHAGFLLLFMLLAAPLASYIPLAALAGVLAIVAWGMAEKYAIFTLLRAFSGDTLVLLSTFLLTIFRDLIEGIVVGFAIGSILFINRMAQAANIEMHTPLVPIDTADDVNDGDASYDAAQSTDPDVVVYRITGAFFFAAASTIGSVLDRIADSHRAFVIDFSAASFVDSTAANTIEALARKAHRHDVKVFITGTTPAVRRELFVNGVRPPLATYKHTIQDALRAAHRDKTAV